MNWRIRAKHYTQLTYAAIYIYKLWNVIQSFNREYNFVTITINFNQYLIGFNAKYK